MKKLKTRYELIYTFKIYCGYTTHTRIFSTKAECDKFYNELKEKQPIIATVKAIRG